MPDSNLKYGCPIDRSIVKLDFLKFKAHLNMYPIEACRCPLLRYPDHKRVVKTSVLGLIDNIGVVAAMSDNAGLLLCDCYPTISWCFPKKL
jgi:hypothetical protein